LRELTRYHLHFQGSLRRWGESANNQEGRREVSTMNSTNRNKAKMLGAVIGGSAVVTMGALAMSIHQQPAAPQNLAAGRMTMAATTTESGKDSTVVATSMAVPAIKGPAKLPVNEAAAV
jgi:hypothetical protein